MPGIPNAAAPAGRKLLEGGLYDTTLGCMLETRLQLPMRAFLTAPVQVEEHPPPALPQPNTRSNGIPAFLSNWIQPVEWAARSKLPASAPLLPLAEAQDDSAWAYFSRLPAPPAVRPPPASLVRCSLLQRLARWLP